MSKSAQKYLAYKDYVGLVAKSKIKEGIETPVKIEVKVFLYGKKSKMGMDGDIDNYLKAACDSLNKIAFKDDRQVVYAVASKQPCYEGAERMEIKIEKVS